MWQKKSTQTLFICTAHPAKSTSLNPNHIMTNSQDLAAPDAEHLVGAFNET